MSVQNAGRVSRILSALNTVSTPNQMDIPGYKFHSLKGKYKGRYSIWVNGNYRITFGWSGKDAIDVDLEDYH